MLRNQGVRAVFRVFLGGILLFGFAANAVYAQTDTINVSPATSEARVGTEITFSGSFPSSVVGTGSNLEYRIFRCNTDRNVTPYTNLTGAARGGFGDTDNCTVTTSATNGFGMNKSRTLPTGSDAPKYTLVDADFTKHLYFAVSTSNIFSVGPVYSLPVLPLSITLGSESTVVGGVVSVRITGRNQLRAHYDNSDFSVFECPTSTSPVSFRDDDQTGFPGSGFPSTAPELNGCGWRNSFESFAPTSGAWTSDDNLTITIPGEALGYYFVITVTAKDSVTRHFSNAIGPIGLPSTATVSLTGDTVVGEDATFALSGTGLPSATYRFDFYRCAGGTTTLPKNPDGTVVTSAMVSPGTCAPFRLNNGFAVPTPGSKKYSTNEVQPGEVLFATSRNNVVFEARNGPYAAGGNPAWGSGLAARVEYRANNTRRVTLTWTPVPITEAGGRTNHYRIWRARHDVTTTPGIVATETKVHDDTRENTCTTTLCTVTLDNQPWEGRNTLPGFVSGVLNYRVFSFVTSTEMGVDDTDGSFSDSVQAMVNAAPTATPTQAALDAATPLALMTGGAAKTQTITFSDQDLAITETPGDSLTYSTPTSSNENVATATYDSANDTVTVTPGSQQGSTRISVTAQDGAGASVSRSFMVTVNAPPMVVGETQRTLSLAAGTTMEVTMQFTDMDALTFTAESANENRATVSPVSGSADADGMVTVTVTAVTPGEATDITVTARDGTTGSTPASITFSVTVTSDPALGIDQSENQTQTIDRGSAITPITLTAMRFTDENALMYTLVAAGNENGTSDLHGLSVGGNGTTTATVRGTPDRNGEIRFVVRATSGTEIDDSEPIRISVTGGDTPSGDGSGTASAPAPAAGGGGGGGAIAAIVIAAGAYFWWKKRQIANGNAAAMAVLPDVSFDLDRNDRRAFYTRMNWQNSGNSNWQLRGNAKIHTKYSGKLLDWHANSHLGYRLNGKFGEINPYLRGKFVANDPENAKMDETYTVGVNYAIPNRFSAQFLQPDDEIWRYSFKTEVRLPRKMVLKFNQPNSDIWRYSTHLNWQISERIGLNLSQPNNDLPDYGFGVQWRGKSKIRYGISGETGRNSYRFTGSYAF